MHQTSRVRRGLTVLIALASVSLSAGAQQVADLEFAPLISRPAYPTASGPLLCVDEAHHNFHTIAGRFAPFAALARRDGYRVSPLRAVFTASALRDCDLLVIANAQSGNRPWDEYPRPTPSAFSVNEIAAVREWVVQGGALLLLADHMPLAGAAAALGAAFGAQFTDGFAYDSAAGWLRNREQIAALAEVTLFTSEAGTLGAHAITRGRRDDAPITQVRSFTGQAFRWEAEGVVPLMILPANYVSLEPEVAWQFTPSTPVRRVGGWLQGAAQRVGAGRVVLLGEAAMLSAQRAGRERLPMGMNAPGAEQNAQFALNILHWLSELLDS